MKHIPSILVSFLLSAASVSYGQTTPNPTSNVGATPNTNVQPADLTMSFVVRPPQVTASGTTTLSDANALLTVGCGATLAAQLSDKSTYALINIVRFGDNADGSRQIASNNWYVFSRLNHWFHTWSLSDFDGGTRLYGAKRIVMLGIYTNVSQSVGSNASYKFTVTKTLPSNITAAEALLGAVLPAPAPGGPAGDTFIGCASVPIAYSTSSIKVDSTYPSTGGATATQGSQTFVNESRQYWDVSFALPVKKASALQYSSTANTVTATQINKQSLFATVDLYLPPANLSATAYSLIPHPFAGVAMDSQPLHSLLFGGAVGLHLAEVYVGALLIKQQELSGLSSGASATPGQVSSATTYGYKASLSVGIKISISSGVKAFKK